MGRRSTATDDAAAAAPALVRTTIDVHGHRMLVEYDPALTGRHDVDRIQAALNRYPAAWIHGAHRRAQVTGERLPRFRLVGSDGFPTDLRPRANHLLGYYDRAGNAVYLNIEAHDGYEGSPDHALRGDELGRESRDRLLGTTAIHELAHYLDDAAWRDGPPAPGYVSLTKATELPKAPLRGHDGAFLEGHRDGAFRAGVIARNASSDPRDYVTAYDRATNFGKASPKIAETFADLVTDLVLGGAPRRAELLAHPRLGPPTRQAVDFLEGGLDLDALIYDRAIGEGPGSRQLNEEQTGRFRTQGAIELLASHFGVELSPQRTEWLRTAPLADLERVRDHLEAHGRWP